MYMFLVPFFLLPYFQTLHLKRYKVNKANHKRLKGVMCLGPNI